MQASLAANRRLDPATATWLKISATGMVLEVILEERAKTIHELWNKTIARLQCHVCSLLMH